MKYALIFSFLIQGLNGSIHSTPKSSVLKSESTQKNFFFDNWKGNLDTITTNVFYPNGKRRLFY
jgi:hypothetical protein